MNWANNPRIDAGVRHGLRMKNDAAYRERHERILSTLAAAGQVAVELQEEALVEQRAMGWAVGNPVVAPPHVIPNWAVGRVVELREADGGIEALVMFTVAAKVPELYQPFFPTLSWRTTVGRLVAPPEESLNEDGTEILPAFREMLSLLAAGAVAD